MSKSYVNNQAIKKKFAYKLIIFLIILAVFFTFVLVRFARSGTNEEIVNNPPKNEDVYTIAKQFVKQNVKTANIVFPETGYQFDQKTDSTYTIKSYLESKDTRGEKTVTSFVITLQFFGGDALNKKRWKMVSLIKD
ncbi:hypothetical protein [Mucilaginibacter sp. BT774]|uniref:hypothetical protein n=1 Tax=Mucilaginibacter sp. BT774 TaxID=3062276 RepID=UPI002674FB44|nr:hypothetical protein [Mucilaginibacter sp. BT774]MDO3625174.1 hypothetical protein [Mucilaginibacter sp. BT774]